MRTREEINNKVSYNSSNVVTGNQSLLIEVLLDIREQNTEIIRNLEYLCKKIIM